jgi:hypothetical protein
MQYISSLLDNCIDKLRKNFMCITQPLLAFKYDDTSPQEGHKCVNYLLKYFIHTYALCTTEQLASVRTKACLVPAVSFF